MKMVAKFRVTSVTHYTNGEEVILNPVAGGSSENISFWNATPSGTLKMFITNPSAQRQFQPGDYYYLTFKQEDTQTTN